jgi:glycosyltransferase involved in cell wall biosynthesis|tara:strand:- start:312928 stop:314085 length:1158 start_codon:yes stop_codon:yes gene_type:complete
MVVRKRVGLIFSYNENWIAGAYYILNIIHALNTLDDSEKPILVILTESAENFSKVAVETKYPYLEHATFPFQKSSYSVLERAINKLSRTILDKNIFKKKLKVPLLDFVYPAQINKLPYNIKKVNWVPDFQEDHLPNFFSKEEIQRRKNHQKEVVAKGDIVVISSKDAKSDFLRLYPSAKAKSFVLHFAVTHPDFSDESIDALLKKYKLPKKYFFAPNQFWAHKNHNVVLKAVKYLKEKDISVIVAFSGKEDDYRNAGNFKQLQTYIAEHGLEDQIRFLGFLPRMEQLCLFKQAQAIIQPSLFEGWSTVIEDAKALGKYVIASNLAVHKEQLTENVSFFDPNSPQDLAQSIELFLSNAPEMSHFNYKTNIFEFGKRFKKLIQIATS